MKAVITNPTVFAALRSSRENGAARGLESGATFELVLFSEVGAVAAPFASALSQEIVLFFTGLFSSRFSQDTLLALVAARFL